MKKLPFVTITAAALLAIGAGCGTGNVVGPEGQVDTRTLTSLSPEEVTKQLTFKVGSSFLIQQTVIPFEGDYRIVDSSKNERIVNVVSYSPMSEAEITWELNQFVETDESRAAREAYEAGNGEQEEASEPPEPEYGQLISSGVLTRINLSTSHELTLPVRWEAGERALSSSAVWVSNDVFRELSRTRNSTIYLQAIDAAHWATVGSEELQSTVASLREHVRDISDRVDVDFMKAEGDVVEWPIRVNGEDIRVEVIKARNWFGEIVVLNNPSNPLVLKFEFNPSVEGIEAGSEEMNIIRGLLSYEITEIAL